MFDTTAVSRERRHQRFVVRDDFRDRDPDRVESKNGGVPRTGFAEASRWSSRIAKRIEQRPPRLKLETTPERNPSASFQKISA